jgi:hypothetical protein
MSNFWTADDIQEVVLLVHFGIGVFLYYLLRLFRRKIRLLLSWPWQYAIYGFFVILILADIFSFWFGIATINGKQEARCAAAPPIIQKITNAYFHEHRKYSFRRFKNDDPNQGAEEFGCGFYQEVLTFGDVPSEQSPWLKMIPVNCSAYNLEIHLHHYEDLEGGGWDHGKFGKGRTIPLEAP